MTRLLTFEINSVSARQFLTSRWKRRSGDAFDLTALMKITYLPIGAKCNRHPRELMRMWPAREIARGLAIKSELDDFVD